MDEVIKTVSGKSSKSRLPEFEYQHTEPDEPSVERMQRDIEQRVYNSMSAKLLAVESELRLLQQPS